MATQQELCLFVSLRSLDTISHCDERAECGQEISNQLINHVKNSARGWI